MKSSFRLGVLLVGLIGVNVYVFFFNGKTAPREVLNLQSTSKTMEVNRREILKDARLPAATAARPAAPSKPAARPVAIEPPAPTAQIEAPAAEAPSAEPPSAEPRAPTPIPRRPLPARR